MGIDIVEIRFGIANGQISSNFYGVICPRHDNGMVLQFNVFISSFKEWPSGKYFLYFHESIIYGISADPSF